MGKKIGIAVGLGAAMLVLAAAVVWFWGGSGEPSVEVTAPTIRTTTTIATQITDTTSTAISETAAVEASPGQVIFDVDKTQSSVQFEIDEIRDAEPTHVIGTTSEVAGQILIDFDNPENSQLGTIVINLRTLSTGSQFRDRAIRGPILGSESSENEFAQFNPTSIDGLPESVAIGDTVRVSIAGDLLVSGTTNQVVFEVEIVIESRERIHITGSANVLRSDFGLSIPSVPRIASVSDEISLVLDLVALSG